MPQPSFGIVPPGYRLPAATRVGAVHLLVSDLSRSLRFYQDVLGFHLVEHGRTSASLGAVEGGVPLVRLEERPGTRRARPGSTGLYHFAILLPDRASLGALVAHLEAGGVAFGGGDHLVSEALYLSDPTGLGIEVYADRPADTWRTRGNELVMTTEPVDADDLLHEAGERAWEGMPAATRIGHVHLTVGDLARAEAFYHRALGFDKTVWSYPGALFFSAGGYHHHLGTNTWGHGEPAAADEARLLGWELLVPSGEDVAAVAQSLEDSGYAVETDPAGSRSAADPWGQIVNLARDVVPGA